MGAADAPEEGAGRPMPHPARREPPNKHRGDTGGEDMPKETMTDEAEQAKPEAKPEQAKPEGEPNWQRAAEDYKAQRDAARDASSAVSISSTGGSRACMIGTP